MGRFGDIEQVFRDYLELPAKGKTYRIPGPDAELGLKIAAMFELGTAAFFGRELSEEQASSLQLDDVTEEQLYRRLLGERHNAAGEVTDPGLYDVLLRDGLSIKQVGHMAQTVMMWIGTDESMAEIYWNTGGDREAMERAAGKALPRSQRRHGSINTDRVSTTQRQDSGNSTTRRRRSGKR